MAKLKIITAVVLALLALGWVGEDDAETAAREAARYCQLVDEGVWPNYEKRDCNAD